MNEKIKSNFSRNVPSGRHAEKRKKIPPPSHQRLFTNIPSHQRLLKGTLMYEKENYTLKGNFKYQHIKLSWYMPVKQIIPYDYGMFFITFTCIKWLPLIERTKGYDIIYQWFQYLQKNGHFINGYVIMPNHVHLLVSFTKVHGKINTIIGNGKRFMAYEIIRRLKLAQDESLLNYLHSLVEPGRQLKQNEHRVWENSFDWKECRSPDFIQQKLDYIHSNPCTKKWSLCSEPTLYLHSSAEFYTTGINREINVTHFMKMDDISLMTK